MALEIIDKKIVGTIDNLQEKLNGDIPVNKIELLELINSWGRNATVSIYDSNDNKIKIDESKPTQSEQTEFVRKECYTHLL